MLALVALTPIRAATYRPLADSDLVDITSSTGDIKDFFFICSVRTSRPVSINQEHSLGQDSIQSLKIGLRRFLAKDFETFLLILLSWRMFGLLGVSPCKFGIESSSSDLYPERES